MLQNPLLLNLPESLRERLEETARATGRTPESVAIESLEVLFGSALPLDSTLARLPQYTDAELWAVVYRSVAWVQAGRMRDLMAKRKVEPLSAIETDELAQLLDVVDELMLLRSEALRLLQARGQDVMTYLKRGI